ncbi:MAG: NERD domain-containing protein [Butyrivibrio sp.]|nr:NERD domain-containing protein [Butyrivibrio sp.]
MNIIFKIILIIFGTYSLLVLFQLAIGSFIRKKRGDWYEEDVANALQKELGAKIIRNVIFNKMTKEEYDGFMACHSEYDEAAERETEIDVVAITTKGIFCVECKSRKEKTYTLQGNLYNSAWRISGPFEDSMMNPFNQNYKHVKMLEALYDNVYNVVCTNMNFKFDYCGITRNSKDAPYFSMLRNRERTAIVKEGHGSRGVKYLAKDIETLPDVYSVEKVQKIYKELLAQEATKAERKRHAKVKESIELRKER